MKWLWLAKPAEIAISIMAEITAQLRLPPARRAAVCLAVLDGGHMMYLHDDSRAALTALAAELIAGGVTTAP